MVPIEIQIEIIRFFSAALIITAIIVSCIAPKIYKGSHLISYYFYVVVLVVGCLLFNAAMISRLEVLL